MGLEQTLQKSKQIQPDYLNIGSSPPEETCVMVGEENYFKRSRAECTRYIQKIREFCGPEPFGARLATKAFPHDFGTYHEVVCHFCTEEGLEYALKCEGYGPMTWDDVPEAPKPKAPDNTLARDLLDAIYGKDRDEAVKGLIAAGIEEPRAWEIAYQCAGVRTHIIMGDRVTILQSIMEALKN